MLTTSLVTRSSLIAVTVCWLVPNSAQAGPFLEWLFGGFHRRQPPAYPVGQTYPVGNAASMGAYYGASMPVVGSSGYGYAAQSPVGIGAATMPQPTVTLVPDYRTSYNRVPVTYYRPIMTTDPKTGAQIVTLAPCTSYEYQTQRVPTWGAQPLLNTYGMTPANTRPAVPSVPTYTLPSGGIPLAGSIPSASYATGYPGYSPTQSGYPGTNAPYSTGYGNYSTLQPPVGGMPGSIQPTPGTALSAPPSATPYPTSPYGTPGGYYGSGSGGSCGHYAGPSSVPGLAAPYPGTFAPAPATNFPPPPQNTYPSQPIVPGTTTNPYPLGPTPSQSNPGGTFSNPPDPNSQPVLPPASGQSSARFDSRAPMQNVVRQPVSGSDRAPDSASRNESKSSSAPLMMPIPVPEKYKHEPRWNPGLLRESDQTAQNTGTADSMSQTELWGSKPIQWASFTTPVSSTAEVQSEVDSRLPSSGLRPIARERPSQPALLPASESAQPMPAPQPETKIVPLTAAPQTQLRPILELSPANLKARLDRSHGAVPAKPGNRASRYNTGGWQAAR